ncbi:unnamed protein product [Schistocephalus solidus]|uniref:Uncharacterized protein n=1 Tax=Schistocephalus solidus TaxID=70667 RepID=A0A183STD7_SCHSO|nr:unnamed protein product [Schistocephalus solidus]
MTREQRGSSSKTTKSVRRTEGQCAWRQTRIREVWYDESAVTALIAEADRHITSGYTEGGVKRRRRLVEALPPTILSQVQILLRDPSSDAPKTKLKAELLRFTSVSDRQRYHALVKEETLGNRKPSELLRWMRSLVWNMSIDDKFFKEIFVVADVPTAILGADFRAAFDLLIDCRQLHLHDRATILSAKGFHPSLVSNRLPILDPNPDCHFLPHDIFNHIKTTATPVFSRPHHLAPFRLATTKAEVNHMFRQSDSPWASPVHMVPRPETNDWLPCSGYRTLSNVISPDRYPVLHPQDFDGAQCVKSML